MTETREVWLGDADSDGRLWLVRSPWPSLSLGDALNVLRNWAERDSSAADMEVVRQRVAEALAWDETRAVESYTLRHR